MATLMHDNGADIRTIQAILEHESLDTTRALKSCSTRILNYTPPNAQRIYHLQRPNAFLLARRGHDTQ